MDQPARMAALMTMSAMCVVGLAAFLGVVLLAYVSVAERVLRREQPTFRIRRAHGASPAATSARLAGFVALALLILPVPPLILLPEPMPVAARWIIALLLVLSASPWAVFTHVSTTRR